MKQILFIIFGCLLGQVSLAQTDSVFLSINSRLVSEIQIIIPHGENATRENYTHFKHQYWLGKVDTISMFTANRIVLEKPKKEEISYTKFSICDSIINEIRNGAQFWDMQSNVNSVAKQEIGFDNEVFNSFKSSESNRIRDFYNKCQNEFTSENSELNERLLKEIQNIKKGKIDRYTRLKSKPESIDFNMISTFLKTFDHCETDLKSIELIIIQHPTYFVNSINDLSESEFFTLTLKLRNFPHNAKISEMKKSLKEVSANSKRTKKVIQKIKKQKASKELS